MATTSTNHTKKPILIIRSPENSSKTIARNVRFVPEILDDNEQVILQRIFFRLTSRVLFLGSNAIVYNNDNNKNKIQRFNCNEKFHCELRIRIVPFFFVYSLANKEKSVKINIILTISYYSAQRIEENLVHALSNRIDIC